MTKQEIINETVKQVQRDLAIGKKVPVVTAYKTFWLDAPQQVIQDINGKVFVAIGKDWELMPDINHWIKIKMGLCLL